MFYSLPKENVFTFGYAFHLRVCKFQCVHTAEHLEVALSSPSLTLNPTAPCHLR